MGGSRFPPKLTTCRFWADYIFNCPQIQAAPSSKLQHSKTLQVPQVAHLLV